MVEMLLNQEDCRVYVDVPDYLGNTALHYASREGHLEVVQLLMRRGADPNMENNEGCTVLVMAVRHERLEVVKHLLSNGANVNANTRFDEHLVRAFKKAISGRESALSCAVRLGNESLMDELLKSGAMVNEQFSLPIHNAVKKGDLTLIMKLLEHKVNLDGKDIQGLSPLNLAILLGKDEMVEMLLDMGVQRDYSAGDKSSLFVAFQNGQTEIAKLLYKRGAYITFDEIESTFEFEIGCDSDSAKFNSSTGMKGSLIHKAVIDRNTEMVQLLVERGIDVSSKTANGGQTPLILATQRQLIPLVELLMTNGDAALHLRDDRGKTPMYYSTIGDGSVEICKIFLDTGLPVNNIVCTETNRTALHSAVCSHNKELIELLVLKGADLSAKDCKGNAPFHLLLENGSNVNDGNLIFLVKTLIEHGADTKLANSQSETPLEIAIKKCSTNFVKSCLEEWFEIDPNDVILVKSLLTKLVQNNHESLVKIVLNKVATLHFAYVKFTCGFKELEKDKAEEEVGDMWKNPDVNLSDIVLNEENTNTMVIEGFTPLQIAMYQCDYQLAEYLLCKGANVNVRDVYGLLPIHLAIIHGNVGMVKLLNDKKSSSDSSMFEIPLVHLAVYCRNFDTVGLVVAGNLSINSKDKNGDTPLHIAAKAQNNELVDIMLMKLVEINKNSQNLLGDTAFHIALKSSNYELATSMMNYGVSINIINLENSSALHLAAANNLTSIISTMLRKGVTNINKRDFQGRTALDCLVENFHTSRDDSCDNTATELVISFLKNGATVHSVFWALVENNRVDLKRVILECKPTLSLEIQKIYYNKNFSRNEVYCKMPLYLVEFFLGQGLSCPNWILDFERYLSDAINKNNITAIKQLLDVKVDSAVYKDLKSKIFLELFLKEGRKYGLAQIFLDRNVNVNFCSRGFVPLVKVAQAGDCCMVNLLLDKGARINATFDDGRTALHCAAQAGNHQLVQILLERGASTHMLEPDGRLDLDKTLSTDSARK